MNPDAIRAYLNERPFTPIEVHLSSGTVYSIRHPECAFVMKNTLVVGDPEKETVNSCSLIHVTNIIKKQPVAA